VTDQKPREIAVRVLRQRRDQRDYAEKLLDHELSQNELSPSNRGLCQELVYGVVRWQRTLDWLIARKTTPGRSQNTVLQCLLQTGLYQLFWLNRIPNHAAVHETVELAKDLGFGPQAGFVNAILRGYTREREATLTLLQKLKQTDPALGYSHPEWLVARWTQRFGPAKTDTLLNWDNLAPSVFARLNTLKADAPTLRRYWEQEDVQFTPRQWDWTGPDTVFELQSHRSLPKLRSFSDGYFYVQDPSTLLAVRELDPKPGETILDLCAAPGGKTVFIAQLMGNQGKIDACDSLPDRLQLIQENCKRLGVTCVQTATAPGPGSPTPSSLYDRILIDAPCSNTGVLRRRIDLRWRVRPEEIQRLSATQASLLDIAVPRLKPGGTLVYSTCSLEPEENEQLVRQFLATHPGFRLEHERPLLPFDSETDGAYVAVLIKNPQGQ